MELVTKAKPKINSVEVHSQLSNNRHPVDGALVGAGSLWPKTLELLDSDLFIYLFIYLLCRELELAVNFPCGNLRENWNTWFFKIQITAQHWYIQLMYIYVPQVSCYHHTQPR
jgi:hypothetical protein